MTKSREECRKDILKLMGSNWATSKDLHVELGMTSQTVNEYLRSMFDDEILMRKKITAPKRRDIIQYKISPNHTAIFRAHNVPLLSSQT